MWKIFRFPLLITMLIVVNVKADETFEFELSFNYFAMELSKNISESKGNENAVFSPASVQSAAVLAFLGAGGKTETDIASGLGLPTIDKNIVAERFGIMLQKYNNHSMVTFEQKLFIKKEGSVNSRFEQIAKENLTTIVEKIDFGNKIEAGKTINDWVEQKTHGKITKIVEEDSLNEKTIALIVNVLYFKGVWETQFPKENTKKQKFWTDEKNSVEVDFMSNSGIYDFAESSKLKATIIKLPFGNSSLSMTMIVPFEKTGLKHVQKAIKYTDYKLSDLMSTEVELAMPKFKAELEMDLAPIFKKMGMASMFENSNFTGIDPKFEVSEIIHKAVLEVSEEGAEGAAVTALFMTRSLDLPAQVVVDRPFMYFITGESNEILFAGHVFKP